MAPLLLRTLFVVTLAGACATVDEGADAPSAPTPAELPAEPEVEAPDVDAPTVERAPIKRLEFARTIDAPVEEVWNALTSKEGYAAMTAPFMQGSYFEGEWKQGERMYFLAPGGSGMVAVVSQCKVNELIELEHVGFVSGGVEDTTSDGVKSWAPAYETYRFRSVAGGTEIKIENDVLVPMEAWMTESWRKALDALAVYCETN